MKNVPLVFLVFSLVLLFGSVWAQVDFTDRMAFETSPWKSMVFDGSRVWVNNGNVLSAFDPSHGQAVSSLKIMGQGESLGFDGSRLLLTQNKSKKIVAVNLQTGALETYLDLKTIPGDRELYLDALRNGEIVGITCSQDRIWIGCSAGYSSSIYEIDPVQSVVVSQRFSPGPSPIAMLHHEGDLWVLDPHHGELRCLKGSKDLVYDLRIPVGKDARALLNIGEKVFVGEQGNNSLRGIAKKTLATLVPIEIDQKVETPYFQKVKRDTQNTYGRKVALLISGDTAASGYNEFWLDVVLMYRILKARGYEEQYVLYADGKDYSCGWSKYDEKMTDFPALKDNVSKIFNALAFGDSSLGINALSEADTLFVFTFDHGANDGKLCLWNGQRYSPSEMASVVKNIQAKEKYFYMQQCFSGAFKEEFAKTGLSNVTIATACSNTQYAYRADTEKEVYNGKTYYHGEFNWHFMSALQGVTPAGQTVNADTNADSKISIQESFDYYKKMNSQSAQTPQFHSNPSGLAQNTP